MRLSVSAGSPSGRCRMSNVTAIPSPLPVCWTASGTGGGGGGRDIDAPPWTTVSPVQQSSHKPSSSSPHLWVSSKSSSYKVLMHPSLQQNYRNIDASTAISIPAPIFNVLELQTIISPWILASSEVLRGIGVRCIQTNCLMKTLDHQRQARCLRHVQHHWSIFQDHSQTLISEIAISWSSSSSQMLHTRTRHNGIAKIKQKIQKERDVNWKTKLFLVIVSPRGSRSTSYISYFD